MINGVAMAGLDGRLTYVNSSFLKMWGYDSEAEVLDRSFAEFWQSEEEAAFVVSALHERGSWAGELPAKRKDGAAIHVQLSASMITSDEGRPVHMVGSFIDITQRREAERMLRDKNRQLDAQNEELQLQRQELLAQREELRKKTAELEDASRHKSEFLARMSHELRTPLNAIIGFSELMLDGVPGGVNEEQRQCLADICDSGRHLLGLINDVLDLSKVEAGRMEFRQEDVAVPALVASVIQSVRPMLRERQHRLFVRIEEGLPPVRADERRFRQVLLNLLSNAIKFTPPGGEVSVEAGRRQGMCLVSVVDSGVGIGEEDQAHIFEPFVQGYGFSNGGREGTGLGLALSRQMVDMMGGHVWVESTPGHGSTFRFTLPLRGQSHSAGARG